MTNKEAINELAEMGNMLQIIPSTRKGQALNMAISALKDIEKIQIIVDTYFTRGSKSGYECMGEIDRILEPYQKGGE